MNKKTSMRLLPVLLVLAGLIASTGFFRVGQGSQALVVTFGKVTDTKGPGLYWHMPLIQSVIQRSVTNIYNVEFGYRTTLGGTTRSPAEYTDVTDESVMLTNDNSIVQLEAIYQYTIKDVKQYIFDVEDPQSTMHLAFESILRRNIQNRSLDDALLNKDAIEAEVLPDFQALIDKYEMGVKIHAVHIQNITVPKAVTASYEDVNNAKNEMTRRQDEAQQFKNRVLPIARANAYQTEQQALQYQAQTVADARAEVAQFAAVLEKYRLSPEVSRARMTIETLEEVLGSAGKIIITGEKGAPQSLLHLGDTVQTVEEGR